MTRDGKQLLVISVVGITFVVLYWRFVYFNLINSVNIPFADQWPLYQFYITRPSIVELFTFQYGPHRQGLGYVLSWVIASLSNWNIQAEVLLSTLVQGLTAISLLFLKKRLFQTWHVSDVYIPISVFSLRYFEVFTTTPNLSLAVFPIFLVTLLAHIWISSPSYILFFSIIAVVTIFSGFGMLVTPLVILLLLHGFIRSSHAARPFFNSLAAIFVLCVGCAIYFLGYSFTTSVECNINPLPLIASYPLFIGSMILNQIKIFFMFPYLAQWLGFLLYIMAIYWLGNIITRIVKSQQNNAFDDVQVLLVGVSVLFIFAATIGRACLDIQASQAPRYLLYLLPINIAFYFYLLQRINKNMLYIIALVMLLFIQTDILNNDTIVKTSASLSENKRRWVACYFSYNSVPLCNQLTEFNLLAADVVESEVLIHAKENGFLFYSHQSSPKKYFPK